MDLSSYNEKVLDYLEYLGYPDYIQDFEPVPVAKALALTAIEFWGTGQSYRMCALVVFSLTLNYQIPQLSKGRVH